MKDKATNTQFERAHERQAGIDNCPACLAAGAETFFSLPSVPIHCNQLHGTRGEALNTSRGDICLALCTDCGMIYNAAFDDAAISYDDSYENALHHSPHFRDYATRLAARLVTTYRLKNKAVLEIGCGDGYFLHLLIERGAARGFGFDPGHRSAAIDPSQTVEFFADYFGASSLPQPVDLICCRQVLEHIPKPQDLLAEVAAASKARGQTVVYFDVPDARFTFERGGIWDILYEHCSYYSPVSLSRLFHDAGYRILRIDAAYGGQFLCIEACTNDGGVSRDASFSEESQRHVEKMLSRTQSFVSTYRSKVRYWDEELERLDRYNKRVALWGAGTKGAMFLNSVEMAVNVGCVIDVNPIKQGSFVSGSGHSISAPDALTEYKPDVILLMNSNYRQEISALLSDMNISTELRVV